MAACVSGYNHTITLSNDGTVYSFGCNIVGELGLGHHDDVSIPTPIPNLPKIKMISCGGDFTVCVDHEGFIWSFGENNFGQLGTGNKTDFNVPQKLLDIPPVLSVSCGSYYTLMITNDSNLWSCGNNQFGQLCQGDKKYRSKPQKTLFSNITKVSAGRAHSLFENNKGEIFSCGYNHHGQCGLGHFNHPQITLSLILNAPSNIVQFVGDTTCINTPKVNTLKNIKQISSGRGNHFLIKNSQNQIFATGHNEYGQLGTGEGAHQLVAIPIEIGSQYSTIWRDELYSRAKSARK